MTSPVAPAEGRKRPSSGSETRAKILRAGERMFAECGIGGVSLREINRVAGQANRSAVQYYFGDRDGLVQAILARHAADDEIRRHALLDEYERGGTPPARAVGSGEPARAAGSGEPARAAGSGELQPRGSRDDDRRALVAAFVLPLVAKLADPDGGREYLRISAEYYSRPLTLDELVPGERPDHSMVRWHRLLDPLMPADDRLALHARFPALRFGYLELARRAAQPPHRDDQLFASHLIDLVTAALASRPSARTSHLLDLRRTEHGG